MGEVLNDRDGQIVNFWRAVKADPEEVAYYASCPLSEIDLIARNNALKSKDGELRCSLISDPGFYCAKTAGYWVWGISGSIGNRWLRENFSRAMPSIGNGYRGGVHSYAPYGSCPDEILVGKMLALAGRLREVAFLCGDWIRSLNPSLFAAKGEVTGIFLDPPYKKEEHGISYKQQRDCVWDEVTSWCEENGENPLLRIVLSGYAGTWTPPASWKTIHWEANGGYANQAKSCGRENKKRETLWISPHCFFSSQLELQGVL